MKENDESSKYSAYKYTAYQMRVASKACEEAGHRTVAGMLQQAAEVMEREEKREKKYEYKILYRFNGCLYDSIRHSQNIQSARKTLGVYSGHEGAHIVRREVGEWEEVDDVQQ